MLEAVPLPSTWAAKSYNNKSYYLVEVSKDSDEYYNIENHFDNCNIITIERIQNPYQYGKFLLYKLQKNSPSEQTYFMPLKNGSQLEIALRFNCDYRRLEYSNDLFFSTVSGALAYAASYNKLIVLQGLIGHNNHDSGRYPTYVVTFKPDN